MNFSKFCLIFKTALSAAAPFKSVVEDAALAEVFGTFDVFVEDKSINLDAINGIDDLKAI